MFAQPTPKFQEEYSAKIPALALLCNLGWTFLSPEQAISLRKNSTREVVLRDILRVELKKRSFTVAGSEHNLSDKAIDSILSEICNPTLNEGLDQANERIYNHLLLGIAVTEFIDGKKANPTIQLIDWHNIHNNSFHFTEEFSVLSTNGVKNRRPDIVCFVNGIPLVVIEAKRPDSDKKKGPTIEAGISQCLRNQRNNEIPHLFAYSQLLLSINGTTGKYATQGTLAKFWAMWREEIIEENELLTLKNKKLDNTNINNLFSHRPTVDRDWYGNLTSSGNLVVTDQDRMIICLLSPVRLIEFIRFYIIYDKTDGKIVARYPQVFAIKRLLQRINTKNEDGGREGGVIWHTTGSGKSYTMVFLSKALILHEFLKKCRIFVVTDRRDLERQLSGTFKTTGEIEDKKDKKNALATSGRKLAEQISQGTERIIFSLIQKFNTATKLPECHNESSDIVVIVDEGHRSQGGENHIRMKQALPNAAFIAFTGTPLLKDEKTTNKFGPIVHAYTMQRAIEDKAVTPLLYEERIPDLDVNERAIDTWFERITVGLTEEQKSDLKKKFAKKGQVYQSEDRIHLIALDIANHFDKNIDDGLKGQLACDSKLSAIKYKKFLDEAGLFESAVVMSAPDTREGNTEIDETAMPEVVKWWRDNVGNQDEESYTKNITDRFKKDDKLKLLIVVDKLLTGFNEPRNAVLYIDKPLKEHNLLQAIARVNRLHEKKKFGLLIDYRGILAELDTTIAKYHDLASRTQGGYDIEDIVGLYQHVSTEYKQLPQLYKNLWSIFKNVKNKHDIEQLRQVLVPHIEERNGELIDTNQKMRDDFYEALSKFSNCLKIALQSATFFEDKSFSENDRQHYKESLKQFSSLRQIAKQDANETIDYDEYSEQVKKLMDKHVVGIAIKEPKGAYEVFNLGQSDPKDWSKDKLRNETDIIKTRTAKRIEQDLRNDPYAQETFSALLRKAIEEAAQLFEHPLKQYMLFREFEEQVKERKLPDLPNAFKGNIQAQAYFGVFKMILPPDLFTTMDDVDQKKWVSLAFTIDDLVKTAIAENSISPQNIEADIRKKLLPLIFNKCKMINTGLDQAKEIVEYVVQITRGVLIED
jgi:type I restriction enzyme R subunit